jgi:glycerol-3-phosphate O-acyltransferase
LGKLTSLALKLFYSGIQLNDEQIKRLQNIPEDAAVVYATKYKSKFYYLFYYSRYQEEKLPFPQIGLDYRFIIWQPVGRLVKIIFAQLLYFFKHYSLPDPYASGYVRQELLEGRRALLSLIEKKGFYRRFVKAQTDPLQYLIEMQLDIERPIYIVPQLMFFSKAPHRSTPSPIDILMGTGENPGKIRRVVTLFKNPGKVFVELSEPLNIKEFLDRPALRGQKAEYQALALRKFLLDRINRHRISITGPILKTLEELKESILTNERLKGFMEQYSQKRDLPIPKVRKEADSHLEEIAAKYNNSIIKIGYTCVSWILKTMFEGVTVNQEMVLKVKNAAQKAPLVLIPCHKSHIDYLILSFILYFNNMPCPHIAAGKNLSFWPVGPIFRGGGAFFIRRTFRGAVLYSKVFAEYIHKLLAEGFNVEFFIEGGRSRTGKLILPQLGLLSILLNAYRNRACDDLIFVPIFIGYDRVLEENAYIHEIGGGQKEPESFFQVLKARKFLKKRYGRIYIKFHDPMSLNEILSNYSTPYHEMTSKEHNALVRSLGHRVITAINRVSVVTPHALAASAILNCSLKRVSLSHILFQTETYLNYLFSQNATLADTLIIDHVNSIKNALNSYVQEKIIDPVNANGDKPNGEAVYKINEVKRPVLEYYKNNCISFFIPAAFTSLAILKKDAFQFSASDLHSDYKFLQDLFINEFPHDVERTPEFYVRKSLKAFIDEAILMPHPTLPDTFNLTSAGFRKLKFFSSFIKPYFESYWIVLHFFSRNPRNAIDTKDRLKKIMTSGNKMYKRKAIDRLESVSKINYKNAVDFFISSGIRGAEDKEKIKLYVDALENYLAVLPL